MPMLVGWKINNLDLNIASNRYRALLPLLALRENGYESHIFSDIENIDIEKLDVLVIVKSFTEQDLKLAIRVTNLKIPLIIDLCDNIFVPGWAPKGLITNFQKLMKLASLLVVPTEQLALKVRKKVRFPIQLCVIPDGNIDSSNLDKMREIIRSSIVKESKIYLYRSFISILRSAYQDFISILRSAYQIFKSILRSAYRLLRSAYRLLRSAYRLLRFAFGIPDKIRRFISILRSAYQSFISIFYTNNKSIKNSKILLWFGNHGGDYANFGMLDLLNIQKDLEAVAKEFNVRLVVVSNNRDKFEKHISKFDMCTEYYEWSIDLLNERLKEASVVLLPNSLDPFSECKSPNRAVIAISAGIPVVATKTKALAPFVDYVNFDDFYNGICECLLDSKKINVDIQKRSKFINKKFGIEVIKEQWLDAINKVIND